MCPNNDAYGTNLTVTIINNDGSLVCAYANGVCHYDVNKILLYYNKYQ
jgi:hypothetical protein